MGAPKNFYNAVDLEKMGINNIDERILPDVSASDNGKIAKVIEGKWNLGTDNSMPGATGLTNGQFLFAYDNAWVVNPNINAYDINKRVPGTILTAITLSADTNFNRTLDFDYSFRSRLSHPNHFLTIKIHSSNRHQGAMTNGIALYFEFSVN